MKAIQLNYNWQTASNAEPTIEVLENSISISFKLNNNFEHIDENAEGTITFQEVLKYSSSQLLQNKSHRFSAQKLECNNIYELKKSKWENEFPENAIHINSELTPKGLNHYVLLCGNSIIECIAEDYSFDYNEAIEDIMSEKYPKAYFNYYIRLFCQNFETISKDNFNLYTDLYIQLEGKKSLDALKQEIKDITKNNDVSNLLKLVNLNNIKGFGTKELQMAISVILNYKA